jgi:uncharacterized protein (TIGR03437 family)
LISGTHTIIGADKGGQLYVVNGDAMNQPGSAAIFQASTGSIFNLAIWSRGGSANIYSQGEGEPVKCFQVTGNTVNPKPVSAALNSIPNGRIGMTISANGVQDGSGILWETTGDYFAGAPGTLHAYDASNLANELWNSDMNPARDQMSPITKFVAPTVANGKVYVPGNSNEVTVYGLFRPPGGGGETFPSIAMVVNAASYSPAVSPGELVAIFGSNLGPSAPVGLQLDASGSVATTIGDTQVLFDGVAGPLIFASASQVNAVVPFGVTAGTTEVQVQYQGQASQSVPMIVVPAAIGIFSLNSCGVGQAFARNQDGSLNSPFNPAAPGSVVTFLATGVGQLSPAGVDGAVVSADNLPRPTLPVHAMIGGQPAEVQYADGAPGVVEGVTQVNLRIPAASQTGAAVPLLLQVGDSTSQPGITLAIQATAPAVR